MGEVCNKRLRICVVGGGAAGLGVTKIFKDSEQHKAGLWSIDVYEEREDIGGTWLPAPATDKDTIPASPMYDSIFTNLPHPIMCYLSYWFPPSTPLFPKAEVVEKYLRAYAKEFDLMRHVRLNTSITSARWTGIEWDVTSHSRDGIEKRNAYDKLIVANGHYRVPYFPPMPGLDSWRRAGRVTHSAWYRHPIFVGKKVLVVGGGFSGIDIADEMSTVCETLVHAAPQSAPYSLAEPRRNIVVRPSRVIALTDLEETGEGGAKRIAYFEDGTEEADVDHIFLATGYILSFPFLSPPQLISSEYSAPIHPDSSGEPLPEHLHNSGQHLFPITKLLFPLTQDFPPDSIAFVGLPVRVAPLPLFEAQARAVAHVFTDPSALDITEETKAIHKRLAAIRSNPDIVPPSSSRAQEDSAIAHAWHSLKGARIQFSYRDSLHAFAGLTSPEYKTPEWVVECYENMIEMRKVWKEIVERGEQDDWVRGVGEKGGEEGKQEWVAVMNKLLEIVKNRKESEGAQKEEPTTDVDPEKVV